MLGREMNSFALNTYKKDPLREAWTRNIK